MATFNKPSAVLGWAGQLHWIGTQISDTILLWSSRNISPFIRTRGQASNCGQHHTRTLLFLMWPQCRDEDPLKIYFHPVKNIPSGGLPVPISIDKWRAVIGPLIASQSVRAGCDWSACWPRYPANTGGCLVPANCSAAAGLQCCLPRPRLARQIIYNQQLKGGFHCNCCCVRCYQSPVTSVRCRGCECKYFQLCAAGSSW